MPSFSCFAISVNVIGPSPNRVVCETDLENKWFFCQKEGLDDCNGMPQNSTSCGFQVTQIEPDPIQSLTLRCEGGQARWIFDLFFGCRRYFFTASLLFLVFYVLVWAGANQLPLMTFKLAMTGSWQTGRWHTFPWEWTIPFLESLIFWSKNDRGIVVWRNLTPNPKTQVTWNHTWKCQESDLWHVSNSNNSSSAVSPWWHGESIYGYTWI